MKYLLIFLALSSNLYANQESAPEPSPEGKPFKKHYLTLDAEYLYSFWTPSEIVNADTQATGRNLAKISIDPSYRLPVVNRLEYWWTPSDSAKQKEIVEKESEGDSVFERYLATLQFFVRGNNHFYYGFESTAFIGEASITDQVLFIDDNSRATELNAGDAIRFLTVIREHEIGYNLQSLQSDLAPFFQDWSLYYQYSDYKRPYSLTFDGSFANNRVFDSRIVGHGIGFRMLGSVYFSQKASLEYGLEIESGQGKISFSNGELKDYIDSTKKTVLTQAGLLF